MALIENRLKKVIIFSMIGNALEWYDFVLYGQLSVIISKLFFPSFDKYVATLATFGVFAVGFFMRPVGGIFFGYIGDKFGRKTALISSILCMAIPTTCIGLMPTYEQIGIFAPIILTIIRLLQGLAVGGGASGCITFIIEHAPNNRKALVGSASTCSMGIGILFGLIISYSVSHLLSVADFEQWGWRIPFLLSIIIGMIIIYIKDNLYESPKYLAAKDQGLLSNTPVKDSVTKFRSQLLVAFGLYLNVTVPFYILVVFMNNYMVQTLKHTIKDAMLMNACAMLALILCSPPLAALSDKIGRKIILLASSVAFVIFAYPIFMLLTSAGFILPLCGQVLLAMILAGYFAPIPASLVELFPTSIRFTGVSLAYNASAAIFGGTTPLVVTWLIKVTQHHHCPAYYIILFSFFSLLSQYFFQDKYKEELK